MKQNLNYTLAEHSLLSVINDVSVERIEDKTYINAKIFLPASMDVFNGHFPGNPIFPAVLQLALIRLLVGKTLQEKLQNISIRKTKFSMIITPEETITVNVEVNKQDDTFSAGFKFSIDEKQASSGKVIYKSIK